MCHVVPCVITPPHYNFRLLHNSQAVKVAVFVGIIRNHDLLGKDYPVGDSGIQHHSRVLDLGHFSEFFEVRWVKIWREIKQLSARSTTSCRNQYCDKSSDIWKGFNWYEPWFVQPLLSPNLCTCAHPANQCLPQTLLWWFSCWWIRNRLWLAMQFLGAAIKLVDAAHPNDTDLDSKASYSY